MIITDPAEGLNIKYEHKTSLGKYGHPEAHRIKVQYSFSEFEFCLQVIRMRVTIEIVRLDYEKEKKRPPKGNQL